MYSNGSVNEWGIPDTERWNMVFIVCTLRTLSPPISQGSAQNHTSLPWVLPLLYWLSWQLFHLLLRLWLQSCGEYVALFQDFTTSSVWSFPIIMQMWRERAKEISHHMWRCHIKQKVDTHGTGPLDAICPKSSTETRPIDEKCLPKKIRLVSHGYMPSLFWSNARAPVQERATRSFVRHHPLCVFLTHQHVTRTSKPFFMHICWKCTNLWVWLEAWIYRIAKNTFWVGFQVYARYTICALYCILQLDNRRSLGILCTLCCIIS